MAHHPHYPFPMDRPPNEPFRRRGQRADVQADPGIGHPYLRGRELKRGTTDRNRQQRASREAAEREALAKAVAERAARALEVAHSNRSDARWTPAACFRAFRHFYAAEGRSPSVSDLGSLESLPSRSTIARVFGSLNAGLVAAGLPLNHVSEHRLRWSDEEILEALRQAELEGEPTSEPFRVGRRKPWIGTIERRFGSWRVAKALASGQHSGAEPPPTVTR